MNLGGKGIIVCVLTEADAMMACEGGGL